MCSWNILCRVVHTLKDYAIKALVTKVDLFLSILYKVNDLLDEKVNEVSATYLTYPKNSIRLIHFIHELSS